MAATLLDKPLSIRLTQVIGGHAGTSWLGTRAAAMPETIGGRRAYGTDEAATEAGRATPAGCVKAPRFKTEGPSRMRAQVCAPYPSRED